MITYASSNDKARVRKNDEILDFFAGFKFSAKISGVQSIFLHPSLSPIRIINFHCRTMLNPAIQYSNKDSDSSSLVQCPNIKSTSTNSVGALVLRLAAS